MEQNAATTLFCSTLLQYSPALLCIMNESGKLIFATPSVQRLTEYSAEELSATNTFRHVCPDDFHLVKQTLQELQNAKEATSPPLRLKTKDGSWIWVVVTIQDQVANIGLNGYIVYLQDVTQEKHAKRIDEINLSYYNSLFQNHPGMVFSLSPDGIFERVNANVNKLLQYGEHEIVGEHFSKFTAPSFTYEAIKALSKASHQEPSVLEGNVISKNGKAHTLHFTMIPLYYLEEPIGILGIARDITADKAAQKELEKLSLVASKAVSCVVITDPSGRIEWVNAEFSQVTGYSLRELRGNKPGHLLQGQETDPATVRTMHEKVEKREPFYIEVVNYRKNGEKFWFGMNITPMFDDAGNLTQYFAIQNDITERKNAELNMQLLAEDLTRHNKDLQQFNYIVSHNLRTPVANMLGLTSILERQQTRPEDFAKALQNLKQTSLSLYNVLKDLNELLSFRDGETSHRQEVVPIAKVFGEVCKSLQDKIESSEAHIAVAVPEEASLQANKAYVYSIFHNLLANAIKYRDQARPLHIQVKYTPAPHQHIIMFEDNGVGMDMAIAHKSLFKLYGKMNKRAEGRGIGLYMVKEQVESIGGTIDVDSTPGVGTTFTIRINK